MPMANSTARNNAALPNNPPTNTISVDMPTKSANVLSRLACGCQVIEVLLANARASG